MIAIKSDESVINDTKLIPEKEIDKEVRNNIRSSKVLKDVKRKYSVASTTQTKLN